MWLFYLAKFKWAFLVGGVLVGLYTATGYFEQKGYDRAITEIQGRSNEAIKKATDKALIEAQKKMQKALDDQQTIYNSEVKRVANEQKVKTIVKEIYRNVDKIIIKDKCLTIDDTIIRLLNGSVDTNNAASSKDP